MAFKKNVINFINLLGFHQLVKPPPYATPAQLQAVGRLSHCGAGPVTDHQSTLPCQPQLQLPSQHPRLPCQSQLLLQHQLEVIYQTHRQQTSHVEDMQMLIISFVLAGFSRMASISSIFRSHRRGTTPATPVSPANNATNAGENPCKAAHCSHTALE